MKLLHTIVSEAAASTYKYHLFGAAAPTSTNQAGKAHNRKGAQAVTTKVRPPKQRLQGGSDEKIAAVASSDRTGAWAFTRRAQIKRRGRSQLHGSASKKV
jgi:hypothetical protein